MSPRRNIYLDRLDTFVESVLLRHTTVVTIAKRMPCIGAFLIAPDI